MWATDTRGNVEPTPATRSWTISPNTGDPILNAAGDIAYCGNDNDEATARLLDNMPGTVVTLGDAAYTSGTASEFTNCYAPTWGRHKARTTPAPGNHEYATSGASGYFNYFGAAAGDPTEGYYDYRLGAWHVIVLNSNCTQIGGCGAGSPQEQWLRNVLATSEAECTVAVWHHPRFSSGTSHGSNTEMGPSGRRSTTTAPTSSSTATSTSTSGSGCRSPTAPPTPSSACARSPSGQAGAAATTSAQRWPIATSATSPSASSS